MSYEELWDNLKERELVVEVTMYNAGTFKCDSGKAVQQKNRKTGKTEILIYGDFQRGMLNGDFITLKVDSSIFVEDQFILIQDKRKEVKIENKRF